MYLVCFVVSLKTMGDLRRAQRLGTLVVRNNEEDRRHNAIRSVLQGELIPTHHAMVSFVFLVKICFFAVGWE